MARRHKLSMVCETLVRLGRRVSLLLSHEQCLSNNPCTSRFSYSNNCLRIVHRSYLSLAFPETEEKITSGGHLSCADNKGNYNTFHKRPRPRARCAGHRLCAGGFEDRGQGKGSCSCPSHCYDRIYRYCERYLLCLELFWFGAWNVYRQ
jgi:hypothetical protein